MDLSIVIVNWNSRDLLDACLASVARSELDASCEVVVIDAGSFDGSDTMLADRHPGVRFIQGENVGFARANNRAFEHTRGDVLLFLNPDTEVSPCAIATLLTSVRTLPDAGIVGAKLLNSDGSIQRSCIQSLPTITNQTLNSEALRRLWPRSRLWGMAPLFEREQAAHEVEGISGACMMMRRAVFVEAGRFSEDYFMYVEDMDLSCKVRNSGYRNFYIPEAVVTHHGGQSSQRAADVFSAVMIPEATRRFLMTTRGTRYSAAYRAVMLLSALGRLGVIAAASLGRGRNPATTAPFRKWLAILRWSVNRDGIIPRYYPQG